MNLEIWNISNGIFHFGEQGFGQEESKLTFSSDSLFSAIVVRMAQTRGSEATEAWLEPFLDSSPPFVLTSAFPRAGNVLFFPLPIGQMLDGSANKSHTDGQRALKQIRYVSKAIFLDLLKGQHLVDLVDEGVLLQGNSLLLSKQEMPGLPVGFTPATPVWQTDRRPRVTVSREDSGSNLFFTGYTHYAPGCGLWFGVHWVNKDDAQSGLLAALLHDLADAGIGGERSSGFGYASITPASSQILPDAAGGAWLTLSRYIPRAQEMDALQDEHAAYSIQSVGGWLYSPGIKSQRRKVVRMLTEGSIFGPVSSSVPGQMVEVQPTYQGAPQIRHKVIRCGFAVPVGIQRR